MEEVLEIVSCCANRVGCDGCPFAPPPARVCEECGREVELDYDGPECGAEVDGLEPYLWPLHRPDLFSEPEFLERNKEEVELVKSKYRRLLEGMKCNIGEPVYEKKERR